LTEEQQLDVEKHDMLKPRVSSVPNSRPTVGLTLYVKKSSGMTEFLVANDNLLTFLEGPYPINPATEVLRCDRLLLIDGGIGITALLPFVNNHWNVKLAWSVKALVSAWLMTWMVFSVNLLPGIKM
jgi:hypothetical protein